MPSLDVETKFGKEFLDRIVEFVAAHYLPEEVFSVSDLREWAEDNGYEEEE